MKILTRKQFLEMPAGTVYCPYDKDRVPSELLIKANDPDTWINDFLYDDLILPIKADNDAHQDGLWTKAENGESVEMDFNFTGREGLFDDTMLYAVYEPKDKEALIKRLQE